MPDRHDSQTGSNVRPVSDEALHEAGELLRAGQLVAIPTETVYGLAGDATNAKAVARIFEAKGRPHFNPLIVHLSNAAAAERLGIMTDNARRLAEAFWPGPLTLVLERGPGCPVADLASAGLSTIALRVPASPAAQALIKAAGRPLAAPSANRSGRITATRAQHVAEDLGGAVAMILDAGPAPHGLESTVLDATGNAVGLLRPGALPVEAIEQVLGERITRADGSAEKPLSPGQLESHYAPTAALRLDALDVHAGEALLAFGQHLPAAAAGPMRNLSASGNLVEAAANLFTYLRELDSSGASSIAVMPIPEHGLGEAINDRLRRAAAPRPPNRG